MCVFTLEVMSVSKCTGGWGSFFFFSFSAIKSVCLLALFFWFQEIIFLPIFPSACFIMR